jgi:hypothetical protein
LATVFVYDDPDKDWLNIKLINKGFHYIPKRGVAVPLSHNVGGWVKLSGKDWQDLKNMITEFQKIRDLKNDRVFTQANVFYNYNRMDLKFYSNSDDYNHVIVTFERGTPNYERSIDPTPFGDRSL